MTAIRVRRRRFLQLMAATAAALAVQPAGLLSDGTNWQEPLAAPFLDLFSRPESARVIGHAYLQVNPQEANSTWLLNRITLDVAGCSGGDYEGDGLAALLQQGIRQDFADGNTVKLNGWILAITEARLCALTVMASKTPA